MRCGAGFHLASWGLLAVGAGCGGPAGPSAGAGPAAGSPGQTPQSRLYGVFRPVPVPLAFAREAGLIAQELDRIKASLPAVNLVGVFFDVERSDRHDWLTVLDLCRARGLRALVGFAEYDEASGDTGYRPQRRAGGWQLSRLGEFVSDWECATHPALYAVQVVDEPWHGEKKPFYSGDDLKSLYAALKSRAPAGADVRVQVAFSRELWKRIHQERNAACYWDRGMADVVQISALEFQDGRYQFELLDENHVWSRRIIHEKTPEIPLLTTVQVMGRRYGPSPGYWFPRERGGPRDLLQLLTDVTAVKYESEHRLAGLMFQLWDSVSPEARPLQYTLGDRDPVGEGLSQAEAARDAIRTINEWTGR